MNSRPVLDTGSMNVASVQYSLFCHSVPDTESRSYGPAILVTLIKAEVFSNYLLVRMFDKRRHWIPAFAGIPHEYIARLSTKHKNSVSHNAVRGELVEP